MTSTIISIIITALAIEIDKITQFRHHIFPFVALAGLLAALVSFAL